MASSGFFLYLLLFIHPLIFLTHSCLYFVSVMTYSFDDDHIYAQAAGVEERGAGRRTPKSLAINQKWGSHGRLHTFERLEMAALSTTQEPSYLSVLQR